MKYENFIDEDKILNLIEKNLEPSQDSINSVLNKAMMLKGLDIDDASILLNINKPDQLQMLFDTASKIKNEIYGNRLVIFAPLYISNYCSNDCLYCGFRINNKEVERRILTIEELKEETLHLLKQGHKRVLMLMGESHKNCSLEYFIDALNAVYSVTDEKGSYIRRINVEIAPLTEEEFQKLSEIKIGTYTVFQETYHYDTYKTMHTKGLKSNYEYRLLTMNRALENGMHDVGIGALFGLYDYKYEVISLIEHAKYLDKMYHIGPHTISVPRIEPASEAPASLNIPYPVNDDDFKKIVAVLRCAVPYTGIILSTRESAEMRDELFNLGVSQISAGSRTNPGGYNQDYAHNLDEGQFSLNDCRTSGAVIKDVLQQGFIPSFCTACYRTGRVGEDFMDLAKPGLIKLNCQPNALLTLKEYLIDYADDETQKIGEEIIKNELINIPSEYRLETTTERLEQIENGVRYLYF